MIKLQSSDGVIFTVDAATVKQMVTIQTMIDHEDEDSDEVTPVPTVKGKILEKIIQWTEYHKIDHENTETIAWYSQYFDIELQKIFEIISAADNLEVESLLKESCRFVLIKHEWKIVEDAANNFQDSKVITLLLEEHRRNVIVTLQDNKHLRYFYVQVKLKLLLNKDIF